MILYLDQNAHIPPNTSAISAYQKFHNSDAAWGHPSSLNLPGRNAATELENARAKIANLLGVQSPNQIIFTNSCTQACHWGLKILETIKPNLNKIIRSPFEHPAIGKLTDHLPELTSDFISRWKIGR